MGFFMMNWWTFRNTILLWYHFVCCTFSSEIYVYLKPWILSSRNICPVPLLCAGIRFIFSLHADAVVWPLLPDKHVSSIFWLEFSWSDGRIKIDHSPKRADVNWCTPVKMHDGDLCTYQLTTCFEYTVQCEPHDATINVTECVSNGKWAPNVFSCPF